MRYLLVFFAGLIVGLVLLVAGVYYNPLNKTSGLSPLSVTDNEVIRLTYSAVAADSLVYTNDGESQVTPHPGKVLQLWEPPIGKTTARVVELLDSRGALAGIGVKFSSDSESTQPLRGKVLVNSVWHIILPDRGTLFVEQSENYWSYMRDIVLPAYRSSGDSWRGNWFQHISDGPGALGTAWVHGGSGEFAGMQSDAIEAITAKAYTISQGPVAMTGELSIEIRSDQLEDAADDAAITQ